MRTMLEACILVDFNSPSAGAFGQVYWLADKLRTQRVASRCPPLIYHSDDISLWGESEYQEHPQESASQPIYQHFMVIYGYCHAGMVV